MLPVIVCCHLVGVPFGFDDVKLDEAALYEAVTQELDTPPALEVVWRQKCEAIRAAGGYSAAAVKVYGEWLAQEYPPYPWYVHNHLLVFLRLTAGDRSAFRPHAVRLLSHEHKVVSESAIMLLRKIGTANDAAAVADQLKRTTRDDSYYRSIVDTLALIGTEKEIAALEAERKAGLLKDHPDFWAKADECVKAIRERATKQKDLKATPPGKK